ncbi:30S ribosomal protein S9 [Candidatus Margulisiibacteriota bacterium]
MSDEKKPKKVRVTKPRVKKSAVEKPKKKVIQQPENKYYGTGRRKTAVAKVWLTPGSGKRIVNKKTAEVYFCNRPLLLTVIEKPFQAVSAPPMDLSAELFGGGVPAQSDAIRMGVARALIEYNPEYRSTLRKLDLLRRDPREKERKKAGYKRARKSFQYTKR